MLSQHNNYPIFAISACRPVNTGSLLLQRETTSPCWMCMKRSLRYSCVHIAQALIVDTLGVGGCCKFCQKPGIKVTLTICLLVFGSTRRAPSGVRNTFSTTRVWCEPWPYGSSSGVSWTSLKCLARPVKVCVCVFVGLYQPSRFGDTFLFQTESSPCTSRTGDPDVILKCIVSGFFANAARIHHSGSYR